MAKLTKKPFYGPGPDGPRNRCYACDAKPTGYRDRTHMEEGRVVAACDRHRDHEHRYFVACFMCGGPRPSIDMDGDFVHAKCEHEASRGF